jgi:excisionase family DNA binding protein
LSDLTVSQVAKELHIRRDAVVAFLRSGDLAGYDVTAPGARRKSYRIPRQALDAFKAGRSAKAPVKAAKQYRHRQPVAVREFF